MRVIQPLVAGSGQPLRHSIHDLAPYALGCQSSNLGSGNRLNVGRYSFFDPMMALLYGGKAEMNHLVGQHPIVAEIALSDMLTHSDPASRPMVAETHEVRCRGSRGLHHPVEQGYLAEIERVRIEGNLD
jgi:hypothetical protein